MRQIRSISPRSITSTGFKPSNAGFGVSSHVPMNCCRMTVRNAACNRAISRILSRLAPLNGFEASQSAMALSENPVSRANSGRPTCNPRRIAATDTCPDTVGGTPRTLRKAGVEVRRGFLSPGFWRTTGDALVFRCAVFGATEPSFPHSKYRPRLSTNQENLHANLQHPESRVQRESATAVEKNPPPQQSCRRGERERERRRAERDTVLSGEGRGPSRHRPQQPSLPLCSKHQTGADVLDRELRKIADDLRLGHARGKILEDVRHGDSQPTHARLAAAFAWIDSNPI